MAEGAGVFVCPTCRRTHDSTITAPRQFQSLHLRAGRQSGKSKGGAHAVREELLVPNSRWWVCGPTFKVLHDSTMPTLLRLIPPDWVKNWNQDNLELILINNAVAQMRSLDDPERGRGPHLDGVWLDECAKILERAWHVLSPSLVTRAGVVISTTSPAGFDWSYHTFYKPAVLDKRPGFWAMKFKTIDSPIFTERPDARAQIDLARATLPPDVFAAEYEGEDVTFTGAIYGQLVTQQTIHTLEELKKRIPEWPDIDPSRPIVIGLDSGADHPFGATKMVVTPSGLIVIDEYLARHQALSVHFTAICQQFHVGPGSPHRDVTWAANKNEAQLRLEFGLRGIGLVKAENKHAIGIQRVQSWLHAKQLWFVIFLVPKTVAQMLAYRYADNYSVDGQKRQTEEVFKKDDELCDDVRYSAMAWPELPSVGPVDVQARERWDRLDDRTKLDIQRVRDFNAKDKSVDLEVGDEGFPIGDFFGPGAQEGFW